MGKWPLQKQKHVLVLVHMRKRESVCVIEKERERNCHVAEFYFGYKAGSRCHSPCGVAVERVQGQTPMYTRARTQTYTHKQIMERGEEKEAYLKQL